MRTWCVVVGAIACASVASAANPLSISFDMVEDFEFPGGSTTVVPSGEPSNAVGLMLPGQVGPP